MLKEPKKTFTLDDLREIRNNIRNGVGKFAPFGRANMTPPESRGALKLLGCWISDLEEERVAEMKRVQALRKTTREEAVALAKRTTSLPYQPESSTSRQAAQEFVAEAPNYRVSILAYLLKFPYGKTAHQLEVEMEIHPNTLTPRLRELKEMGLVVDSGRTRENPSGMDASVLVAWKHADADEAAQLEAL